mgnify:CR=1 FL=1
MTSVEKFVYHLTGVTMTNLIISTKPISGLVIN